MTGEHAKAICRAVGAIGANVVEATQSSRWCSYTGTRRSCSKSLSFLRTGTAPIPTWQFVSAPRPTSCETHAWGNIPPVARFVHVCVTKLNRQMQPRASISAPAATSRWLSVPAATAATSTAPEIALRFHGATRNAQPDSAINGACVAAAIMLREPDAIVLGKNSDASRFTATGL